MKKLYVFGTALLLGSCSDLDVVEKHYASRGETRHQGTWVPKWVPGTAYNLHDVHNKDTTDMTLTFFVPLEEVQPLVGELQPVSQQHESAARKIASEQKWFEGSPGRKVEAFYSCIPLAGVLIVDRSTGRALYHRHVMWAYPPCRGTV